MIDPKLFTVDRLLATMLDTCFGNDNAWRALAEILPEYRAPFAREGDPARCVVRCGDSFLRYSHGPKQGHFWDTYGEDYQTPELALLALLEAPIPPAYIDLTVWKAALAAQG